MLAPFHGPDNDIWSLSIYDDIDVANRYISKDELRSALIAAIISIIIAPFIALANGIVVAAIWKDPYKQLRSSPSNIIIASMACCDFLVGVVSSSAQCYAYLAAYKSHELTANPLFISHASGIFFIGLSFAHVVVLSADRVLAVSNPFLYKVRVTKSRLMKTLVFIWVLYFFLASLHYPLRYHVYIYQTSVIAFYTITVLAACVLSAMVVYLARKRSHELKVQNNVSTIVRIVVERDRKTTRTILLVIMLLLLCCSPFAVVGLMSLTCTKCSISSAKVLVAVYILTLVLLHFNSLVNPFLYAFRLPKFKKPIKRIVKSLLNCKRNQVDNTPSNSE